MSKISITDCNEGTRHDHLPPIISSNIRQKVEAAQIPIAVLKLKHESVFEPHKQLVSYSIKPPPEPIPVQPILLAWEPEQLHFDLFEKPVEAKLRVWNRSARPIQLQCCGLWDDTSRLGASWRCYPRTRFWLPPGLHVNMFVCATPRPISPILSAYSSLQIAATHLRDIVTGYFMVPIQTCFLKYVQPIVGEVE